MRLIACTILLVVLAGCHPLLDDFASQQTPSACAEEIIRFTPATGCRNDGSFEFCIPADDPAALAQVFSIAPNTTCVPGRGRAGCDTATQLLCLVGTDGMCQADQPEAMTNAAWQTTCDLAGLPFISQIVPTWYE
ncbi:MAG: hypothetical protein K8J31_17715 [Anaerolineae bacterium]|nr:hypothetical protein [Anaerolineae bacterium]